MSLYLKYRPKTLDQIKGNTDILVALEGMLEDMQTCPHSFLLHGQTGCGKTTLARIIAERLGCSGTDFTELNSADVRGIDTVREIIKNSQLLAMGGKSRVWVIDECHKMTGDAQNALLKILEDTPSHVYFILCTTDPQKLLATVKGRCVQFQLTSLTEQQMFGLLRKIVRDEKEDIEKEVYDQIINDAQGLPRNALQILEQVLSVPKDRQLEIARQTALVQTQGIDLCRALIKRESWGKVRRILEGLKDQEAETIRRIVLGYCQAVLLKEENDVAGLIMEEFINPFYDSGFPQLTYACYTVTKN
jgi:DNA polymerase III gamma/tau subunit